MKTALDPRAGMGGVPAPEHPSVRIASTDDAAAMARTLALAFFDDPFMTYCAPRASTRLRKWEVGLELQLRRIWLRHATSYTTPQRDGVAVWLPPGAAVPPVSDLLRILPRILTNGGFETLYLFRALALFQRVHPSEPHFYLPFVGVLPERRGRGIGHALLQPILEKCDRDGVPAYLEATKERGIPFFERNGFEVLDQLRLPNGGPAFWPMWRKPVKAR